MTQLNTFCERPKFCFQPRVFIISSRPLGYTSYVGVGAFTLPVRYKRQQKTAQSARHGTILLETAPREDAASCVAVKTIERLGTINRIMKMHMMMKTPFC